MHISIETTGGLERRLTISLPSESFEQEITDRLNQTASRVRLPGFRSGKVPLREVRRRFGPSVRAEVAGELMQSSFLDAIRQEALNPAGSPHLEVVKMDPGIDFEFTATFEVFPIVELADLGRVTVKKPQASVTDADVDEMVERLREQRKDWHEITEPAAEGHRVTLDFEGFIDDEPFDGGSGEDVSFVIGAGQMIRDFDDGIRGLAAGDRGEFQAVFPDDYQSEELRGQTATFKVKVKEVAESIQPELNDEFFKTFGIDEGGEEAFRIDVRSNMQREMAAASLNQVKSQVMKSLAELHELALPEAMIAREMETLKSQMLQQFQAYGGQRGGAKQPDIDLPDELFRENAESRVTVGLVVNEIVEKASLKADAEKVRERIETLAAGYADPQQVVNYYYGDAEQLKNIEMAVLEEQVVEHILEQAHVEIVETTYADVISGSAVAEPEPESDPLAETPSDAQTPATALAAGDAADTEAGAAAESAAKVK